MAFFVDFFRFSNFQHLQKMGILIFPKIVSATIFGLIIHIIKLFQTVQIQKARFKKIIVKMSLKNLKKSKWCKTSFDEYIIRRKQR